MTTPSTAALRVLVAEDDETLRDLSRRFVEKLGHRVSTVADGADAVRAALSGDYDVVLMDVHMPLLDGPQAAQRIRDAGEKIRQPYIIALTAAVTSKVKDACLSAGMNAFVTKPYTSRALRQALQEVPVGDPVGGAGHREPAPPGPGREPDPPGAFPALAGLPALARTEVLRLFRQRSTEDIAALISALEHGAAARARFLAHRLHGASATVGATALAGLCAAIESAPADELGRGSGLEDTVRTTERVAALRAAFDAVASCIEATERGHSPA